MLTPEPVRRMMATTKLPEEKTDLDGRRSVNDPCRGSGRMLLAAAEIQPNWICGTVMITLTASSMRRVISSTRRGRPRGVALVGLEKIMSRKNRHFESILAMSRPGMDVVADEVSHSKTGKGVSFDV